MILNLILNCAIQLIVGIVGIVGVETKEDENENVEYIDNSLIDIYEKFRSIQSRNDKKYDKFNFKNKNSCELNINNYKGTKPIPIPLPYK
jgi:hypothetical protein